MSEATFEQIKTFITEIYHQLKDDQEGNVASYIPQLSEVNPELFGISVCTVRGETFEIGDTNIDFSIQSCSKPLVYSIARDLLGEERIHQHVGYEPSGQRFNAFVLDDNGHPHNPMINAGAIMVSSLIKPNEEPSERYDTIRQYLFRMTGNSRHIGFDNSIFLSEKDHAHRNRALAHYMCEQEAFPPKTNLAQTLDLYFQACSITLNTTTMAIIAATLANSGTCPITAEKIFDVENVRDCLSLMYMCGMYDYSGQFAFKVGLPAKSGVSGCLMLIIPQKMGICIWSPPLDKLGNTVRGVKFCHHLVKKFNYHIFHHVVVDNTVEDELVLCQKLITAASKGDNEKVVYYSKKIDIGCADYDGRTAIHLAAAEGHLETVQILLELGSKSEVTDRWGNTPYHEVRKKLNSIDPTHPKYESYQDICSLLHNDSSSTHSDKPTPTPTPTPTPEEANY